MRVIKINLNKDYTDAIREAVRVLKEGGTIVYPTDTIYGIGCDATNYKAVETVYRIKDRQLNKPLSVIGRNMEWMKELALIPTKMEEILGKLWPGAVTVILPKKSVIPSIVTSDGPNVGLRIPDYPLTDMLLAKFGYPIISTSANMAGGDEASTKSNEIIETFKPRMWQPDLMLDAGDLPLSAPSTVIDFTSLKPRILRVGPVNPKQLEVILGIQSK